MGRIAAILAAAIAGVASLPALLGSDSPPPVPPDVGLVPSPAAPTAPAPEPAPAAAPPPELPPRLHKPKERPDLAPTARQRRKPAQRHRPRGGDGSSGPPPLAAPPLRAPAPVYAYPVPSSRDNLGIEP